MITAEEPTSHAEFRRIALETGTEGREEGRVRGSKTHQSCKAPSGQYKGSGVLHNLERERERGREEGEINSSSYGQQLYTLVYRQKERERRRREEGGG